MNTLILVESCNVILSEAKNPATSSIFEVNLGMANGHSFSKPNHECN